MANIKLVIDSNIWISFFLIHKSESFAAILEDEQFSFVASPKLINEILEVIERPKFKKFFPDDWKQQLSEVFSKAVIIENELTVVTICRDPKDNFLLSLSLDSQADYLISHDEDLLVLKSFKNTKIVTLKEFLSLI